MADFQDFDRILSGEQQDKWAFWCGILVASKFIHRHRGVAQAASFLYAREGGKTAGAQRKCCYRCNGMMFPFL